MEKNNIFYYCGEIRPICCHENCGACVYAPQNNNENNKDNNENNNKDNNKDK